MPSVINEISFPIHLLSKMCPHCGHLGMTVHVINSLARDQAAWLECGVAGTGPANPVSCGWWMRISQDMLDGLTDGLKG